MQEIADKVKIAKVGINPLNMNIILCLNINNIYTEYILNPISI